MKANFKKQKSPIKSGFQVVCYCVVMGLFWSVTSQYKK